MNGFYNFFCKVEFLCYQNEPNWLGWLVIGLVGFSVVVIFIGLLISFPVFLYYKYFYNTGEKLLLRNVDKVIIYHGIRYRQEVEKGNLDDYILKEDFTKDPYEED